MSLNAIIGATIILPLIGGLFGFVSPRKSAIIAIGSVALSFLGALALLAFTAEPIIYRWEWLPGFLLGILVDKISMLMIALVTFISLLVFIFSSGYMHDDKGIHRYYAKLGLFVTSMIGLLLTDHIILLFVFWELVGFSSYLLIGFWYGKVGVPSSARMAFMVNRVADACLIAGILLVYHQSDGLFISEMSNELLLVPSLLITIGAFGKSAQLPFSGWLTKAMVGPTPVSALIHAATMVAAGVYLLFRMAPFLHPDALIIIALTGTFTALYGGLSALNQHDIKKVLAYSTISQLGYMMVGIGVGARDASLLHLFTHAFFKAGLFLAAASLIHYMHSSSAKDAQDMRAMGGLKHHLPWTYRVFLVCALALAGVPFLSGFISKEGIIIAAWNWANEMGTWAYIVPDLALVTALLTAFYIGRALLLVFFGEARNDTVSSAFREPRALTLPLILLGIFSFWVFFSVNPFGHESWLMNAWGGELGVSSAFVNGMVTLLSILMASTGLVLSYAFFKPNTQYASNYQMVGEPTSLGGRLIYSGFHLTGLYETIAKITAKLSVIFQSIDQRLIDPLLHFVSISAVVFTKAIALVDRFVVDGPVNLIASVSRFVGRRLAALSSRDAQTQLFWLMVLLMLILAWILFR